MFLRFNETVGVSVPVERSKETTMHRTLVRLIVVDYEKPMTMTTTHRLFSSGKVAKYDHRKGPAKVLRMYDEMTFNEIGLQQKFRTRMCADHVRKIPCIPFLLVLNAWDVNAMYT